MTQNGPLTAKVFFDDMHLGTRAAIFDNALLTPEQMQQLAMKSNCEASVFVCEKAIIPKVRIFNSSNEIQWCGHGLLAIAHYLSQSQNIEKIQLPSGLVAVDKNKDSLWIGFEPLVILQGIPAEIDLNQLGQVFSHKPNDYAFTGDKDSYLILEWASDFDLSILTVDFEKLPAITQRAVIVTQRANDDYDFKYRYFAPQHGVNEDPATGSANRVLALYWQEKLAKSKFTAEQVSSAGAIIMSKIEKNKVWISGKVKLIKEPK